MKFQVGHKYKTRAGYLIRIYATDDTSLFPIHGAFFYNGAWRINSWDENGFNTPFNPKLHDAQVLTDFDIVSEVNTKPEDK